MTSDPSRPASDLSPRPVRLAVYAAMVAVAVVAIWLIDRRAMDIQARYGWTPDRGQLQQQP